jgi:hypothetical protein
MGPWIREESTLKLVSPGGRAVKEKYSIQIRASRLRRTLRGQQRSKAADGAEVARGAPGERKSFSLKVEGPIKGEWCPGCCNNRKDWRSRIRKK